MVLLPEWLSIKPASTEKYSSIKRSINSLALHTVCVEAHCPNMSECWSAGTATFMILGDLCTRGCNFCAVRKNANGSQIDLAEPTKLAGIIKEMHLDYVVITSVCRDDLPDQGAGHFANCVMEIKRGNPGILVEVLIPDFRADEKCLKTISDSSPDVIGHNIETVRRLSPKIRDRRADYDQSLEVLRSFKKLNQSVYTKSAMMLGIGETEDEIIESMKDLRDAGVDFLAMGQYMRPSSHHIEVKEFVKPETFERLKTNALSLGFKYVAAGPFVRSSYKAGEFFIKSVVQSQSLK